MWETKVDIIDGDIFKNGQAMKIQRPKSNCIGKYFSLSREF